jgi:hypothetical protein
MEAAEVGLVPRCMVDTSAVVAPAKTGTMEDDAELTEGTEKRPTEVRKRSLALRSNGAVRLRIEPKSVVKRQEITTGDAQHRKKQIT